MALHDGVAWPTPAGGKAPRPCKTPGCGLVYTPGFFRTHVRDYHGKLWREPDGKLRTSGDSVTEPVVESGS